MISFNIWRRGRALRIAVGIILLASIFLPGGAKAEAIIEKVKKIRGEKI